MKGKQIYSDGFLRLISPFMAIKGITLFPFIISQKKYNGPHITQSQKDRHKNHESIHIAQQLELVPYSLAFNFLIFTLFGWNYLWLFVTIVPVLNSSLFFILYLIEFIFKGYRGISFEREAYENDDNLDYLKNRKYFNFTKYF